MGKTLKIYIAYHKESEYIKNSIFEPIQVGKAIAEKNLDIIGDDTGDNISYLNKYFSELSALYWIWKNSNEDFVGLCHYRRFFSHKDMSHIQSLKMNIYYFLFKLFGNLFKPGANYGKNKIIRINSKAELDFRIKSFSELIPSLIEKNKLDIISTDYASFSGMMIEQYFAKIGGKYIEELKVIVKDEKPSFYASLIDVLKGNKISFSNMVIMKKEIHKEYCKFLFDVLFLHSNLHISDRQTDKNKYYERIPGYLAEILTFCFVQKKKQEGYKIKYLPTLFYEP